ncbi:Metalloprotease [Xylariaceae sp. AK1471]|nr:Metalloprotease [Xylariaceae sp. AK1471]
MSADTGLCLTPACVQVAAHILSNLHPNYDAINPCEDFDQFTCGGFSSQHLNQPDVSTLDDIQAVNSYFLKDVLNGTYPITQDSTPDDEEIFSLLKQDMAACMNVNAINASNLAGIPDIVSRVIELFPVGDSAEDNVDPQTYDDLANTIAYLASVGVPVFGDFWTFSDMQNPDTTVPLFSISYLYKFDTPIATNTNNYSRYLGLDAKTLAETLLPVLPNATQDTAMILGQGVLDFVKPLAAIESSIGYTSDLPGNWQTSTIAEASKAAPALVLDKVIKALAPPGYEIDQIALPFKDIYPDISSVISNTSLVTIQAFMILRVVESYSGFTASGLATGTNLDRFRTCEAYLDSSLPWIVSKFWLDRKYSRETFSTVNDLAETLREAFISRVNGLQWADNESKKLIKDKIKRVQLNIGYPKDSPDAWNATSLKQFYSGVNITSSWFDNVRSIRQWGVRRAWAALSGNATVNRLEWPNLSVHSYIVNARAFREKTQINVPAGAQQAAWYFQGAPTYMHYGGIGSITAHEITHNFDDAGSLLDENGRYAEWWTNTTRSSFDDRTRCIVDQFNDIPVKLYDGTHLRNVGKNTTLHVNGTQSLSENISDSGGLNIAFDAWKQFGNASSAELLPGLSGFTREQLFFIAFGQLWCDNYSESVVRQSVATDPHAPNFARIKGSVANSRAFQDAWKCQKEPVCELW